MLDKVLVLASALLFACGTATASPPADSPRVEVRAPIVRISLRVAESYPPQYLADVTSALPDGCAQFARFALRREANTLFIDVFNSRPREQNVACTMIYGEKETAVPLGSDFTPGSSYTIDANGMRHTFVAQ